MLFEYFVLALSSGMVSIRVHNLVRYIGGNRAEESILIDALFGTAIAGLVWSLKHIL